jgi:HEAT repeat protein
VRSRRQAAAQRRAAEVTAAAEQSDLDTLLRVIFAPAWEMNAARALLAAQPVYERVIALLLAGLDDPRPDVRFLAVQALDHVADQRCAPALRRRLDDPVPRVRWAAIHALTCAACKVAPFAADADLVPILVERALVDPSIRVRRVAAASLGAVCHDTRALTALETLAARETDAVLLRNVRWALRQRQKRRPA